MQKKHSYNALKVLQIIRAILLIIMSLIVLSTAIIGHCSSGDSGSLPIMPIYSNNGISDEDLITQLQACDSQYGYDYLSGDYFLVFGDYRRWGRYNDQLSLQVHVFKIPETYGSFSNSITANNYDSFDWSVSETGGYSGILCNFEHIQYTLLCSSGWTPYGFSLSSNPYIKYGVSPTDTGSFLYVPSTICYSTKKIYVSSNSQNIVVNLPDSEEPVPEDDITNINKPEFDDYMPDWDNKPTFDNSSVENALESIYNYFEWFGDNLKDTLFGLGQFIVDSIGWQLQKVIDNIRSKIQEIKETILTVVGNIQDTIDYISQPLQVNDVVTAMQSTDIHTDIVSVVNLSNTAFGIFGTVSEPQNFTIPLDLTGITILHQTQPFYIDLSWIINARTYIRAFMWCIVTFGLLYSIVIAIPSMLKDSK